LNQQWILSIVEKADRSGTKDSNTLFGLPFEILSHITKFLDEIELTKLTETCCFCYHHFGADSIWRTRYLNAFDWLPYYDVSRSCKGDITDANTIPIDVFSFHWKSLFGIMDSSTQFFNGAKDRIGVNVLFSDSVKKYVNKYYERVLVGLTSDVLPTKIPILWKKWLREKTREEAKEKILKALQKKEKEFQEWNEESDDNPLKVKMLSYMSNPADVLWFYWRRANTTGGPLAAGAIVAISLTANSRLIANWSIRQFTF